MKHFIQISDCHIDDNAQTMGVNSHENLIKVVDKIVTLQSDALLIKDKASSHSLFIATIGWCKTIRLYFALECCSC
jgi:hypothetical protein